jgi:NADPH:quinone reductase-like Zn-dependent oxidoreductase
MFCFADGRIVQSFDSNAFGEGAVYGCDFAGEVVEVGNSVSRVNKGDMIAGLIWGGQPQPLICLLWSFTDNRQEKYAV